VPKSRYLHNVPCLQLLALAEEMLAGEIAYRRGDHDTAFPHLRAAIALEDDLPTWLPFRPRAPTRFIKRSSARRSRSWPAFAIC
jgi:hypothetical protein